MKNLAILTLAILLVVTMRCDLNATTIEISADGSLSPFGEPAQGQSGFATVGQIFRIAPGGPDTIESVSFYLPHIEGDDVDFSFYLYGIGGTCLFTSNEILTSSPTSGEFTVDLGGMNLEPGRYVWIISASGYFDEIAGVSSVPVNTANCYTGGFLGYAFTDNDFSTLFNERGRWNKSLITLRRDLDFASSMVIHAPEPCTLLLIGSGLVGLAGIRRKFNK